MNPFDHGSDSSDDDRNVLIRSQRRRGTKEEGLSDKAERESVAAAAEEAIRWMTQAAGDMDRKTASETKMGVDAEAGREVASRRESLSMYSVEGVRRFTNFRSLSFLSLSLSLLSLSLLSFLSLSLSRPLLLFLFPSLSL